MSCRYQRSSLIYQVFGILSTELNCPGLKGYRLVPTRNGQQFSPKSNLSKSSQWRSRHFANALRTIRIQDGRSEKFVQRSAICTTIWTKSGGLNISRCGQVG